MSETYMQLERRLGEERKRRELIASKLQLAYLLEPEVVSDPRVKSYCNQTFNVSDRDAASGNMDLWNDYRTVNNYSGGGLFRLARGALPLTETEQKFVDFVRVVAEHFLGLSQETQAVVAELEQQF